MGLGSALPRNLQQSGPFQRIQVLRHRLPRQGLSSLGKGGCANLEQRLLGLLLQGGQDSAPFRMSQRLKDEVDLVVLHS